MFQRLKLSQQLGLSFTVLLLLMAILAAVGIHATNIGQANFSSYRELARDSNLAGRIQANLLIVRLNALKYINQQNQANIDEFNQRLELLKDLVKTAEREIQKPSRAELVREASSQIEQYEQGFKQVISLYEKRNQLVDNTLSPTAQALEDLLNTLAAKAEANRSDEALYQTTQLLEQLLHSRLYVTRFLVTNSDADYRAASEAFAEFERLQSTLASRVRSARQRERSTELGQLSATYSKAIDGIHQTITARNQIIDGTLNTIGPQVADNMEQVKLSVKADQDALGPLAEQQARSSERNMMILVAVILPLGVFLGWYIPRTIRRPIGGEPREIEAIARAIADGDLSRDLDETGSSGIYRAIIDMSRNLQEVINNIKGSTVQLGESADGLSAVTAQSARGAEHQMQQLDQTSTAMDEMNSTVAEITKSAQLAAEAATEADNQAENGQRVVGDTRAAIVSLVTSIEEVSNRLEQLEKETDAVGSILDVIRGIADQTNLLALNAAIEAARAGEQGRGFAVVADEVRGLASRTQESTEEIQSMISRLQQETQKSVAAMRNNMQDAQSTMEKAEMTGTALNAILDSVGTIRDMNLQIAGASEEQSVVTQHINDSVASVHHTAQETAQGADQASAAATQLARMASELNQLVERFKV